MNLRYVCVEHEKRDTLVEKQPIIVLASIVPVANEPRLMVPLVPVPLLTWAEWTKVAL